MNNTKIEHTILGRREDNVVRQAVTKLETEIIYNIDTGNNRKSVKKEVMSETGCSMKEVDQAIKNLRLLGLIRYEEHGSYLVANFAKHHGKDILFNGEVYTYEDGKIV